MSAKEFDKLVKKAKKPENLYELQKDYQYSKNKKWLAGQKVELTKDKAKELLKSGHIISHEKLEEQKNKLK